MTIMMNNNLTQACLETLQSAIKKLMQEEGFSHARAVAAVTAEWNLPHPKQIPEAKVLEVMQQFRIGSFHARQALGFSAALESRPESDLAEKLETMTRQLASADLVSSHAKVVKTVSPPVTPLEESSSELATLPQRQLQQRYPPVAPRAAQTPAGKKSKHSKKEHNNKKDAPKASRKRSLEESALQSSSDTSTPRPRADSVTQAVTAKLGDLPVPQPSVPTEPKSTSTPSVPPHKRARASSAANSSSNNMAL